jgi:hypothetical protein
MFGKQMQEAQVGFPGPREKMSPKGVRKTAAGGKEDGTAAGNVLKVYAYSPNPARSPVPPCAARVGGRRRKATNPERAPLSSSFEPAPISEIPVSGST